VRSSEGVAKLELLRDPTLDRSPVVHREVVRSTPEAPATHTPPTQELPELRSTKREDVERLRHTPISEELRSRLAPILEEIRPGQSSYASLRITLEEIDRSLWQKIRPILIDRLDHDAQLRAKAHPASHGPATIEKLVAIASGEASEPRGEKPSAEVEKWAREVTEAFSNVDLGSGRLIDTHDRDLWAHRVANDGELASLVAGLDQSAAIFLEVAKHLGFEAAKSPELSAVWPEIEAYQAAGGQIASILPYLDAHGIDRTAWAMFKVNELIGSIGEDRLEALLASRSFEELVEIAHVERRPSAAET
jgi:hypothetical protein